MVNSVLKTKKHSAGASLGVLEPTVRIKNSPCKECRLWNIEGNKKCHIDKQPDENLECPYYVWEHQFDDWSHE